MADHLSDVLRWTTKIEVSFKMVTVYQPSRYYLMLTINKLAVKLKELNNFMVAYMYVQKRINNKITIKINCFY